MSCRTQWTVGCGRAVKLGGSSCPTLAAQLGLDKNFLTFFLKTFCYLPFKATINLVVQMKLLVYFSLLNLNAFVGMKFKPNIARIVWKQYPKPAFTFLGRKNASVKPVQVPN